MCVGRTSDSRPRSARGETDGTESDGVEISGFCCGISYCFIRNLEIEFFCEKVDRETGCERGREGGREIAKKKQKEIKGK